MQVVLRNLHADHDHRKETQNGRVTGESSISVTAVIPPLNKSGVPTLVTGGSKSLSNTEVNQSTAYTGRGPEAKPAVKYAAAIYRGWFT